MKMKKNIKRTASAFLAAAVIYGSFAFAPQNAEAAKTLSQLKTERTNLANKTKQAKAQLDAIKNKKASVQQEIDAVDQMLNSVQQELDQAEADLADVSARLTQSEADLQKAKDDKEKQIDIFGKRIKFFYEQGDIGYIDIIFQAESFSDMFTRIQYVQDIMQYDNQILDNLKKNQETIEEKTKEIEEEKAQTEQIVELQKQKQQEALATMQEKQTLMASYEKDADKYQQIINANEKASQEVSKLISQATAQTSKSSSSSSGGSTYVYTGGKLNWPVPSRAASSSSISSGFVNRMSPVGRGAEKHTGYDIPSSYGSAIVAAESGTVIYSGWMNGYGNTIMINHGGGLVTLYGHNSSLTVSKGQTVSRGQQVAKCGSTGYSTGNHCHFEVRVNGTAVSPESYLGVANVNY